MLLQSKLYTYTYVYTTWTYRYSTIIYAFICDSGNFLHIVKNPDFIGKYILYTTRRTETGNNKTLRALSNEGSFFNTIDRELRRATSTRTVNGRKQLFRFIVTASPITADIKAVKADVPPRFFHFWRSVRKVRYSKIACTYLTHEDTDKISILDKY